MPGIAIYADTVQITVTATPKVTGGISNFTVTYVNDTQLDLSWILTGDAVNIMIRAKYSEYPDDISNPATTPSDGYLVYYGSGSSVSDTSMNLDEHAGVLYYKAWAQKADTTWYINTETGEGEGIGMILIALIFLSVSFTIASGVLRKGWLAFTGAGAWAATAVYCYNNSTEVWDLHYFLFILFCGLIIVTAASPLAYRDTTPHDEVAEESDIDSVRRDLEEIRKEQESYSFLYQPSKKQKRNKLT